VGLGVAPAAGWAVAGRPAGSAHVTAFWAGNRCRELLRVGLAERLEPASFRGAGGFGDRGLRATGGFAGLRGIARALGNLGIASQLLQRVVVVSYLYYYPFYIQFG
jgi:hypothetical protein